MSDFTQQYNDLIDAGISKSTARAHRSDAKRFWEHAKKTHGIIHPTYPIDIEIALQFVLDLLNPTDGKRPLKVATLKRYIASLSSKQLTLGYPSLLSNPQMKILLRRAKRALPNQRPVRKLPITANILNDLLKTCDDTLHGIRDRAILLVGFSSGRRRSELSNLKVSDLKITSTGYIMTIAKSKTDQEQIGFTVPIIGPAAKALMHWLEISNINESYVFRGLRTDNTFNTMPLNGSSISRMIKRRIKQAKLNPNDYGGHSLRSGFLTEAIKQNVPLQEAMRLSGHKSLEVAHCYYRDTELESNRASKLIK